MSEIVWTETAISDLNRHYDFIALSNADAAARAIQAIVASGGTLQQNPRRGAIIDEIAGLRKLIVAFGKYGFIIHYVILEDEVIILRIYHGRENRPI
ncbi:type II toxin-antitoxin system RelE/ParE family toxin [Anabaena cylindrica FACHB-243]|uniref:Plasmid stabilization system n=1 Tax=Anabaena cylindrica (strain ATCC 27899 / PCC 7122) TaxID=272123 RepID=K9ZL30_ANACC|nr:MULTISPECIES: type II toxin-antitoxin system RelE/ParE family toxin [Anabaena]AFZ59237.1 plasmid stabilization system [Anabaena cylindrica PCC 7122]MBD2416592.1 type II toxin-antitoxin system RelE/ParE family toxin [Anabaena cylindrica FACHB-243]MBY5280909.1 type II toxin-antitoxin system RelE/ParE family toxin [Anabaena sp. CCAP 1446/1C]MBY5310540.1 type II toxin-antitoxin system RelE/ParE family toxin [Anabaena sp. CCAP 1446/1C]MCM2407530.1 type II toxin-antitoxin system RelE/ParE family 